MTIIFKGATMKNTTELVRENCEKMSQANDLLELVAWDNFHKLAKKNKEFRKYYFQIIDLREKIAKFQDQICDDWGIRVKIFDKENPKNDNTIEIKEILNINYDRIDKATQFMSEVLADFEKMSKKKDENSQKFSEYLSRANTLQQETAELKPQIAKEWETAYIHPINIIRF